MEYGVGKGERWYYIVNETQLRAIGNTQESLNRKYLLGKDIYLTSDWKLRAISAGQYGMDKKFMQQADIQVSTNEWIAIGTHDNPFTGSYNGNGYEIKGLTMKNPYAQIVGLFGVAEGAQIYNITIRDYDICSAGLKTDSRGISPILVYGNGNTKSYDNFL